MIAALPKSLRHLSMRRTVTAAGFVAPPSRLPLARCASTSNLVDINEGFLLHYQHHPHEFFFDFSLGMTVEPSSSLMISHITTQLLSHVDPLLLQHMATGGALALAGDVIAQSLMSQQQSQQSNDMENKKRSTRLSIPPENWDLPRTAAFVTFGMLYTGGAQHFIFDYLNMGFDEPLVRLALAQFVFIPFCYYPTFLVVVPALRASWETNKLDGFGLEEARKRRRQELFEEMA